MLWSDIQDTEQQSPIETPIKKHNRSRRRRKSSSVKVPMILQFEDGTKKQLSVTQVETASPAVSHESGGKVETLGMVIYQIEQELERISNVPEVRYCMAKQKYSSCPPESDVIEYEDVRRSISV